MHRTSDRSRFHALSRVLDACFDVGGSELHLFSVIDGRKHQRCIQNRTEEIDQLLTWLAARAKLEGYSNVRVVVEATGVYHELLLRMARMRGMETCFVSAEAASKNRVVLFGDTGKTDKRDPVAIADLAARDIVLRDRDLSDEYLVTTGVQRTRAALARIAVRLERFC